MLNRTFFIVKNRATGAVLGAQDRTGRVMDKPAIYLSPGRAKQGRTGRFLEIKNPADWDIVPVQLVEVQHG